MSYKLPPEIAAKSSIYQRLGSVDCPGIFTACPFTVGTIAQLLRSQEQRRYFFIINTHLSGFLYLGIGYAPTLANGIPLAPNGGFYEPLAPSENELYIIANVASVTGIFIFIPVP